MSPPPLPPVPNETPPPSIPRQAEASSPTWRSYIEHLDVIVLDGLFNCVQCSLQYLLDNTDKERPEAPPLLESKLELQAPEMVFLPSLDQDAPEGFYILVEGTMTSRSMCSTRMVGPKIALRFPRFFLLFVVCDSTCPVNVA